MGQVMTFAWVVVLPALLFRVLTAGQHFWSAGQEWAVALVCQASQDLFGTLSSLQPGWLRFIVWWLRM